MDWQTVASEPRDLLLADATFAVVDFDEVQDFLHRGGIGIGRAGFEDFYHFSGHIHHEDSKDLGGYRDWETDRKSVV